MLLFCEPWSRRLRSSRRRSPSPRPSARASNPVSPVGRPVRFHLILITNQPRPPESSVERVKAGLKPTRAWSPRAVYYGLGTRVAWFETRPRTGRRTGRPAGSCLRRPLPTPGRSSSLAPLRPLPIWSPARRGPGPTPSSRPLLPPLPPREMASGGSPRRPLLSRGRGGGTPMAEGRMGRRPRPRFRSYRRRRRRRSDRLM